MGWSCGACTYFNTAESSNKCDICESSRSSEESNYGAYCRKSVNAKKRPKEQKATVQATLFGGIATNVGNRTSKDKKSKRTFGIDVIEKPKVSIASTRPPSILTSSATNHFEFWKQAAKIDIQFSKLEDRTRSAMKQIFNVNKQIGRAHV